MKSKSPFHGLIQRVPLRRRPALITAATVGLFGLTLIIIVRAAGFSIGHELELSTLTGGASVGNHSDASGGKFVVFNANPTPSPTPTPTPTPTATPPVSSGYPAHYNTGYPHGLPGDTRTPVTLSAYTGPCTITTPTTINAKDVNCRLVIRSSGVTITNSRIKASNSNAIYIDDVYHVMIADTEIDGQHLDNSAGGWSLIGDGSYTCLRCNLHGSGDIVRANWGGVAIVDSWLHDGFCLQNSCHNDTIQSTGWTDSCTANVEGLGPVPGSSDTTAGKYCIRIVHNRLENQNNQTSNILLKADQGPIHDVLVENNLFNGGGYSFYWYDSGYQISQGLVRNNRFRRDTSYPCRNPDNTFKNISQNLGDITVPATKGYWSNGGCHGPGAVQISDPNRMPTWTNNVWDDNGAAISL